MARSRSPRTFQHVCDGLYIALCAGCLLAFCLPFVMTGSPLKGFPVLFFLAALLNLLTSLLKFRKDGNRRNQKLQGVFFLLTTAGLLCLSYISAVCLWLN